MSRVRATSKRTSILDIDAQIQELQRKRKELQAKQAERLGRIAMAAGLGEFDLTDDEVRSAFVELAARFRAKAGQGEPAPGRTVGGTVSPAVSELSPAN